MNKSTFLYTVALFLPVSSLLLSFGSVSKPSLDDIKDKASSSFEQLKSKATKKIKELTNRPENIKNVKDNKDNVASMVDKTEALVNEARKSVETLPAIANLKLLIKANDASAIERKIFGTFTDYAIKSNIIQKNYIHINSIDRDIANISKNSLYHFKNEFNRTLLNLTRMITHLDLFDPRKVVENYLKSQLPNTDITVSDGNGYVESYKTFLRNQVPTANSRKQSILKPFHIHGPNIDRALWKVPEGRTDDVTGKVMKIIEENGGFINIDYGNTEFGDPAKGLDKVLEVHVDGMVYYWNEEQTVHFMVPYTSKKTDLNDYFESDSGKQLDTGWHIFDKVAVSSDYHIFGIEKNGKLRHYFRNGNEGRSFTPDGDKYKIGSGWDRFNRVFCGANNIFYMLDEEGNFYWNKVNYDNKSWHHDGPKEIGGGWYDYYNHIFSGGNTRIYGIEKSGRLYTYVNRNNRTFRAMKPQDAWSVNREFLGTGWQGFDKYFGAYPDLIFAVKGKDLYRSQRPTGFGKTWDGSSMSKVKMKGKEIDWSKFDTLLSSNRAIYGVTKNGLLMWFKRKYD